MSIDLPEFILAKDGEERLELYKKPFTEEKAKKVSELIKGE